MGAVFHGGRIDAAIAEYGGTRADWIDLSTGINPKPYPVGDVSTSAWLIGVLGYLGLAVELFIVFALLAQKSLSDHVGAVATGLHERGLEGGREAVGLIVGRDPKLLDQSGVCRAAIESLVKQFWIAPYN